MILITVYVVRGLLQRASVQARQRLRDAETFLEAAILNESRPVSSAVLGAWLGMLQRTPTTSGDERADSEPEPAQPTEVALDAGSVREVMGDLALPALWRVTHARLADYHDTAVGQARRAFRNAQYATGAGFFLLAVFVYAAFHAKSTPTSATAGVLGAVAAALSGYIARTFIRSQEMTSQALHRYFEEPLVLSRYLAAERLVRDTGLSEEHRAELLRVIVQSMITGELPGRPAVVEDVTAPEM
jgi:hypothetical protein